MPRNCPNCGFKLGMVSFGGWTLDEETRTLAGVPKVYFVPAEVRLLATLLEAEGKTVTREKCVEICAHFSRYTPDERLVDVHISRIRKKLHPYKADPIETIRGVGYRIKPKENYNA